MRLTDRLSCGVLFVAGNRGAGLKRKILVIPEYFAYNMVWLVKKEVLCR